VAVSSTPTDLRAVGDRVLLRRVQPGSRLLVHVHETMGVTDRVLQMGEVIGVGNRFNGQYFSDYHLVPGDLVIYPTPRVHDHFEWGPSQVAVIPGYWVCAIVTGHYLNEHPELREYGPVTA
jgi:hypothetical protein